jgi:hypothetical protein
MDEYADFVEVSIQDANPVFADRQKSIEKRILRPFRLEGLMVEPAGKQNK